MIQINPSVIGIIKGQLQFSYVATIKGVYTLNGARVLVDLYEISDGFTGNKVNDITQSIIDFINNKCLRSIL